VSHSSETLLSSDATLVDEQLQLLEKGLRATHLYLPNNPMYHQALTALQNGFRKLWTEYDILDLKVTSDGFEWEGHNLLHGRDRTESMAWVLYKDGVRGLTLFPGCEEQEVLRFLNVVNRARTLPSTGETGMLARRMSQRFSTVSEVNEVAEPDEDLLTLLWSEDLHLIMYRFVEIGQDSYATLEPSGSFGSFAPPTEVQATIQQDAAEGDGPAAASSAIASADDFDSTLYFLDPKEMEHLKGEIDREYEQDLHDNVLAILFDILELQTYQDARGRVLDILTGILPHYLGVGEFGAVATVLREAREISVTVGDLSDDERGRLTALRRQLSEPQALSQLLQVLDESHHPPTRDELGELFRELQPETIDTLLTWIPRLHNPDIRRVLGEAVDPLARTHPEALAQTLESPDSDAVTEALGVVSRLQLVAVAQQLGRVATHEDAAVRRTLAQTLVTLGTPTCMQHLLRLVDDGDRDVRIAAARGLTERLHHPAAPKIESIVLERLKNADLSEKRVFFAAYGVLAREEGIEKLASILAAKGLFRRKDDPETRACAAEALGMVGTPKAREALTAIGKEKDPLVRNAIEKAIREIV